MQKNKKQSRRRFLTTTGAAASLAAAGGFWSGPSVAASNAPKRAAEKLPFELGLASYTSRKFDLKTTLEMTQRVGLTHICLKAFHLALDSTPEEIAQAAAQVKAAGIDLYGGGVITMSKEEEVHRAFEYAKAAGMRCIVGSPAPNVLPLVDKKVKEYDICLAIHNHGPGDKTYPTPQSVYEKIKGLDKRIGLCMDIGHTARIGADPVADAKRFADRLLDLHVKDVSAAAPEGKTLEIGRGVIDIPQFMRTLIEINYSGIASFEYEKDPDDPLPGLAESVGYIRGVLAAI
jgi:sugar phosphate isomerase/epimerase